MEPGNTHLRAENWNAYFTIKGHFFAAGFNRGHAAGTYFLRIEDVGLVIRIDLVGFSTEKTAQGKSDGTARQIKQVGCVNVQVERRELRCKKVAPMQCRKVDQRYVGCDGNPKIVKGIVRHRLPNKISRG